MGIEDFGPEIESGEGIGNAVESTTEISEKYKESSKKAAAGIKRTQKDEKKARKYDFFLAGFLVKIILDKKYDFILHELFKATDFGYTSNFVLGILSLINIEISNKIRSYTGKSPIKFNYKATENIIFDDKTLPKEIKDRINNWIEDIIDSVTIDYSNVQTQRVINCLNGDDGTIIEYINSILGFFLNSINISSEKNQTIGISNFIVSEVSKSLKKISLEEV